MSKNSSKNTEVNRKKDFPIFTVTVIVVAVLVVALVAYNILKNNGTFIKNKTILKYEDTQITGMDFYFPYANLLNSYASVLPYMGISSYEDMLKPTTFDENMTWQEYFASLAYTDLVTMVELCAEAQKDGVELEEEDLEEIQSTIDDMKKAAEDSDISFKTYLANSYRQGFTEENLEKMLRIYTLGNKQQETKRESFTYTDEQIEEYYQEHRTAFDRYTYRLLEFKVSDDSDAADTKKAAEDFLAKVTDEETFIQAAKEIQDTEEDETLISDDAYTNIDATIREWVGDEERKEGDTTLLTDDDDNCYVMYFISALAPDYDAVSIRLIKYDAGYEDDATDEEKEEAVEKARADLKDMIDEWADDGADEDEFATMALMNSSDSSMSNGGLSENFSNTYYDAYSEEISDWVFNAERKEGDYTVIDTDDGAVALYFVSNNGPYLTVSVDNTMKDEDLTDYVESLTDTYADVIETHEDEAIKVITG